MSRSLQAQSLPGFEPEIGRWLWAMEEIRRRTLHLAQGLDQGTLDWEGPGGNENAIGSLLYHIGLVEMSWLFMDILEQEFPPAVQTDFPHAMATEGRLTRVPGVQLNVHVERLKRSRGIFLGAFRTMSLTDWRRLRTPQDEDYQVTPEWAVFHLIEHEAGHAAQISSLKGRASYR